MLRTIFCFRIAQSSVIFAAQTTYSVGSQPWFVAAADVNGDNKIDIIVANSGSNNVGVLLNTGNGTFTSQTTYSTGSGSVPYSVAVADVNGDNKPDIIVANSGLNSTSILLNIGNGTFIAEMTYSTDSSPYSVAAADVNGDTKIDIIVANHGSNNVSVLLNTGNGTFTNQTTYSTGSGSNPSSVVVADVNGDNKPDIIVTNEGSNNVGVFLSLGPTGNFAG
jgi:ankyrin repeat protein